MSAWRPIVLTDHVLVGALLLLEDLVHPHEALLVSYVEWAVHGGLRHLCNGDVVAQSTGHPQHWRLLVMHEAVATRHGWEPSCFTVAGQSWASDFRFLLWFVLSIDDS